jgi:hypothetical protein
MFAPTRASPGWRSTKILQGISIPFVLLPSYNTSTKTAHELVLSRHVDGVSSGQDQLKSELSVFKHDQSGNPLLHSNAASHLWFGFWIPPLEGCRLAQPNISLHRPGGLGGVSGVLSKTLVRLRRKERNRLVAMGWPNSVH